MTLRARLVFLACVAAPLAPLAAQTSPGAAAAPSPSTPPPGTGATVPPAAKAPAPPLTPAPAPTPAPILKPKLSPLTPEPDWKKLEACSNVLTREEFDTALKDFYLEAPSPTGPGEAHPVTSPTEAPGAKGLVSHAPLPWTENFDSVEVSTEPGKPPLTIRFRRNSSATPESYVPRFWHLPQELPKAKSDSEPLAGMQIALDPGHIGGAYAKMEERWLQMDGLPPVMEGQLTLATARVLKPRLEELGARVTMVRSEEAPVTTAKPDDFKELARQVLHEAGIANPREDYSGLNGDDKVLTVQWQAEKLFYRVSEIRARAHRVNDELKPDLVICMHYDAAEWGDPNKPSFVPQNHFHLIINGCYSPNELTYDDVRFEMFERLFQGIQNEELRVGDAVARSMADSTGLPPRVYAGRNARRVNSDPYVWARNLLANRMYQCPVIYLEPYVMNNEETYKRLILGHYIGRTLLGNKLVTSPMEDYVKGIVTGLKQYYTKARHITP